MKIVLNDIRRRARLPTGTRAATARQQSLVRYVRRQGPFIALIAACAFGTARYAFFLTPENILNVFRQNSMLGLVALGMTFVILTGVDGDLLECAALLLPRVHERRGLHEVGASAFDV